MSEHTVYRLFAGDELVYVGITSSGIRRFEQHRRLREWWAQITRAELSHFGTKAEAEDEERRLIKELAPRFNSRAKPPVIPHGMSSIEEIAAWLKIHRETAMKLAKRGLLPIAGETARGVPFFDREEVDAWVVEGKSALPVLSEPAGAETGSSGGSSS